MRAHSYEADTQSSRKVQRCLFTIVSTIPGIINRCLLLPLLLSALLAGALRSWFHSESRFAPDDVEMRFKDGIQEPSEIYVAKEGRKEEAVNSMTWEDVR